MKKKYKKIICNSLEEMENHAEWERIVYVMHKNGIKIKDLSNEIYRYSFEECRIGKREIILLFNNKLKTYSGDLHDVIESLKNLLLKKQASSLEG